MKAYIILGSRPDDGLRNVYGAYKSEMNASAVLAMLEACGREGYHMEVLEVDESADWDGLA